MFDKILVPVDLGDAQGSREALRHAQSMPLNAGGEIHVLTVLPNFGMAIVGSYFDDSFEAKAAEEAKKALSDFLAEPDLSKAVAKGHVATGTIYQEILRVADELSCDLIVMMGHRPEMKDYLLGPNAARVVRHANQSVMVVRN